MEYTLGKSDNIMTLLKSFYANTEYVTNLNIIKSRMRKVHSYTSPQFDDIEAEIVCLLIMYSKPKKIYEFSPCGGWSSLYMLNTLDILNLDSKLVSFDLVDKCTENIKLFTVNSKFEFNLGNVEEKYASFTEDLDLDYLFIDSDHTPKFAKKYIDELLIPLLSKLRKINKKIFVSIHDVFNIDHIPSEEGILVIDFIEKNNMEYFSPVNYNHRIDISIARNNSELDKEQVHYATTNPCIFFILG